MLGAEAHGWLGAQQVERSHMLSRVDKRAEIPHRLDSEPSRPALPSPLSLVD